MTEMQREKFIAIVVKVEEEFGIEWPDDLGGMIDDVESEADTNFEQITKMVSDYLNAVAGDLAAAAEAITGLG